MLISILNLSRKTWRLCRIRIPDNVEGLSYVPIKICVCIMCVCWDGGGGGVKGGRGIELLNDS